MRRIRFIATGGSITSGQTAWILHGEWMKAKVTAFVCGGVSRIEVDGRERFMTLESFYVTH